MKKELIKLIELSDHDKKLTLNGAFELRAHFLDAYGTNVELSNNAPISVFVELVCTMPHDKFLFRSAEITSRNANEMQVEVADKMHEMFCEFGKELATQMKAGYLP